METDNYESLMTLKRACNSALSDTVNCAEHFFSLTAESHNK